LIGGILVVVVVVMSNLNVERRLGLVDHAGLVGNVDVARLNLRRPIPVERFADETRARNAFDKRTIDAYIVIPADYVATGKIQAVAHKSLSDPAKQETQALLTRGLLERVPPQNRPRLQQPANLMLRTLDGGREIDADNIVLVFFLPYAVAIVFTITTFMTSGYLLQALTDEKENRVMEILATAASPWQMMAGKIIGMSAVGLTQVLVWIGLGLGALTVLGDLHWLGNLQLPWAELGLSLLYFVLGYLLIAACYAAVGAAVTTSQEAQQLATPISMVAMVPFFLFMVILTQPNGLLATVLSFIPVTAALTMLLRLPLADIPTWQIALSLALLGLSVIATIAGAARVLRLGMLRYGKRLQLRELFGRSAAA
jgi:ABC-2 type transport system permease protein